MTDPRQGLGGTDVERVANEGRPARSVNRARNELVWRVLSAGPCSFPVAPERDVAKIKGVPPGVEHRAVEAKDTVASHTGWWGNQPGEAIVHSGAFGDIDARKQVPQGEGISFSSFRQDSLQSGLTLESFFTGRVEPREGREKSGGSVFEIRRSGARLAA